MSNDADDTKDVKPREEIEDDLVKKLDRTCQDVVAFMKQAEKKPAGKPRRRRGKSK